MVDLRSGYRFTLARKNPNVKWETGHGTGEDPRPVLGYMAGDMTGMGHRNGTQEKVLSVYTILIYEFSERPSDLACLLLIPLRQKPFLKILTIYIPFLKLNNVFLTAT